MLMTMASRRSVDTSPSVPRSLALEMAVVRGGFPHKSVLAQVTLHQFASIGSETKILKRLEDRQLGECRVGATLFSLPHPINALQANKWKLLKFIDEFAL